jgi:hypothetical protein
MSVSSSRPDRPTSPAAARPAAPAAPAAGPAASTPRSGPALPASPASDTFAARSGSAAPSAEALLGTTPEKPERTEARAASGRPLPLKSPEAAGAGVFLSASGELTLDPSGKAPATLKDKGDALYQAAELLDHGRPNLFADRSVSLARKKGVFASLSAALDEAAVAAPDGKFENPTQKLQQRASCGALLLNLAEGLKGDDPKQKALKDAAFNRYVDLVQKETNPILRDSLIFNMQLAKPNLSAQQKDVTNRFMRDVAPLSPPYEKWFANGNKNLNVEVNIMGEFFDEEVKAYERNGFKKVSSDWSGAVLKKTVKENGVETEVTLNCRNASSGVFNKMSDPNTQMVVYSGHANWGRLVRDELKNAPEQKGDKLSVILQCCGRGVLDNMADKYPGTQVVTTKFSSYASEDQNTLMKTIDGIAKRQPWVTISKSINEDRWNNSRRNYTFPTDMLFRRRQLDRDKDGLADAWDKVVNFNTFNVPQDVANSFKPRPVTVDPTRLEGGKIHNAAGMFNTVSGFSEFLEEANKNQVVDAGWFAPKAGEDALLRIQKVRDSEGAPLYRVQMNGAYAHASQEALNAKAHYELQQYFLKEQGSRLSEQDRKLTGLLLAAHALDIDDGWHNAQDEEVFRTLCKQVGAPSSVSLQAAAAALEADHDYYSGSMKSLEALKQACGIR